MLSCEVLVFYVLASMNEIKDANMYLKSFIADYINMVDPKGS